MTFNQFRTAVENYRNDVIVSKHGDYCSNKSKNTLGIVFINNGKQSKVYNYSGTYSEILTRLGIPHATQAEIETVKTEIEQLKKRNGQKKMFGNGIVDNTEEIKKYKKKLEYLLSVPLVD